MTDMSPEKLASKIKVFFFLFTTLKPKYVNKCKMFNRVVNTRPRCIAEDIVEEKRS